LIQTPITALLDESRIVTTVIHIIA